MKDEFNNLQKEVNQSNEFVNIKDNPSIKENITAPEQVNAPEYTDPVDDTPVSPEKRKFDQDKKNHALTMLTGGLTATIAGIVLGLTTMLNVKMSAEFDHVDYADGNISYQVNVKDMTEKETLTAYVYEENELIETIDLVDEDGDGIIEGNYEISPEHVKELLANDNDNSVSYRFTLKGIVGLNVSRDFDSYVLRIDQIVSEFRDVDYWCTCGKDGYYNFQMNFTDDNNIFTDFEAYIDDNFGGRSYCEFNEDLHSAQHIYVLDLQGASGILTITYYADGELQVVTQEVHF